MDLFAGMYFSNSFIQDLDKLANYLLYYDEVHFGMPGAFHVENWISKENLSRPFHILSFGKKSNEEDAFSFKNLENLVCFVKRNHALVNKCLFFHKEVLGNFADRLSSKLINNEIEGYIDLLSAINGVNDNEMETYFSYAKAHSSEPPVIANIKATALYEAQKNSYYLIFEKQDEINQFWGQKSLATDLSNIMAYNALNLVVPSVRIDSPEEILELREKINDQLVPFRMTMRKLSIDLRTICKDSKDMGVLHNEAQFIIETQVEPALEELRRRIEKDDNKFLTKLFGKVISWIPFLANIYFAPTPEKFFDLVKKVGNDTGELVNEINNNPFVSEPGIGFLLGVKEFGKSSSCRN